VQYSLVVLRVSLNPHYIGACVIVI